MMNDSVQIITVDATNFQERGFFCYKSKPKSEGYQTVDVSLPGQEGAETA